MTASFASYPDSAAAAGAAPPPIRGPRAGYSSYAVVLTASDSEENET
ncbi:Uncharacterised protein [Mycobacteroides abscessus subsp. abscessus]|nr:Uncharacterised protein [Mycobacteroides abscessus subsp. abscessus]